MMEPRSTATIRALASLAELSANQLEDGASVEEVIATLRKAAEAVKLVVDADEQDPDEADADEEAFGDKAEVVQDLTPMDLSGNDVDGKIVALAGPDVAAEKDSDKDDEAVLNAG
ncbi:hypothetical protein [Roseibium sp.]|uniref:hypothetical protein n=1 Tax=Roseibium sp. TaxID=1936156 RepID=UPI00326795CF